MWEARDYQIDMFERALPVIKKNMIVYLAGEERVGKTIPSIMLCEALNVSRPLVITKKNPLEGWRETFTNFSHEKYYSLTNYHMAKNIVAGKHDIIILDESHNYISGYPKPSAIWKILSLLTKGIPIIYISATPSAQTPALLYHQFALSTWSPFANYSNYYNWWRAYGTGETKTIYGKHVNCYDKVQDSKIFTLTDHLFITMTRKSINFEHEPIDKIHYLELSGRAKIMYNTLVEHRLIYEPVQFIADTVTVLRTGMHQIEGGTIKTTSFNPTINKNLELVKVRKEAIKSEENGVLGYKFHNYYILPNMEKINYIKDNFGDNNNLVIMYNYIAEGFKLRAYFKHAVILQATSNAEGIDLSMYKDLVIYSQDFSTARHTQRRARQANKNRKKPIIVHYLLVEKGISEEVYETVSINKVNYVDSLFKRHKL